MKKLFYSLLFVVLVPIVGSSQGFWPLEMIDGYFQAHNGGQQVHLVHLGPYPPQWVYLDEPVHIWYMIALKRGEKSPCDRRSQALCNTRMSFVSLSDPKYSFHVDGDFRFDDQLDTGYVIPIDQEETPLGNGKFVWTIEKDGKILFSHEISVEVR